MKKFSGKKIERVEYSNLPSEMKIFYFDASLSLWQDADGRIYEFDEYSNDSHYHSFDDRLLNEYENIDECIADFEAL